jgi:hypothetical protein
MAPARRRIMILILGSGRSGTTFLGKLFDSHPDVLYRHEPDSILIDRSLPFLPQVEDIDRHCARAAAYLNELACVRAPKVSAQLPFFRKNYRDPLRQQLFESTAILAKAVTRMPVGSLYREIRVPDLIGPSRRSGARLVMKSVSSPCRARLFAEAHPELKIVHLVRHPCGLVASQLRGVRMGLMKPDLYLDVLFELRETHGYGLGLDELRQMSYEEQFAFQWMVQNDKILREMADRKNYRLVRYEDLCSDTTTLLAELFPFCGLEQGEQTRAFLDRLESQPTGSGARYFSVMRSPASAASTWRTELSTDTVRRIMTIVNDSRIGRIFQTVH